MVFFLIKDAVFITTCILSCRHLFVQVKFRCILIKAIKVIQSKLEQ